MNRTTRKMNKRGVMDDLFDFLFTVFMAFLILFIVHFFLSGSLSVRDIRSVDQIKDVRETGNLINRAYFDFFAGREIDFTTLNERVYFQQEHLVVNQREYVRLKDAQQQAVKRSFSRGAQQQGEAGGGAVLE